MMSSKNDYKTRRPMGTAIAILAAVAAILMVHHTLPTMLAKMAMVMCSAVIGYYVDKIIFPHIDFEKLVEVYKSEESTSDQKEHAIKLMQVATIRRALVVAASILGVGLGL